MQRDTIRRMKIADAKIEGRIDAIDNGKIYGWVWDRLRPEDRLKIEVRLGDRVLAEGTADLERKDLAGSGIGDGLHAFVLDLHEIPSPDEASSLVALATSPSSGSTATLRPRLDVGIAPENALAKPIGRIAELLEAALANDRQIQMGQQALARELRSLAPPAIPDTSAAEAAAKIEAGQQAVTAQIGSLEIFALRLDEALAELNTKLARFERVRATEISLRRMVWVVGALAALSLVAAGFAIAGLEAM
jgi:hypothetical protein